MRRPLALLLFTLVFVCGNALAAEPDYSQWNRILSAYYNPDLGLDYKALKAKDEATVQNLRKQLGTVNVASLNPKEQLAYWINVYNVNTVGTILENYPVKSIRDISTDPIIRLNVFKKERVPFGSKMLSLNDVENTYIRDGFKDPRIHFAINCAALTCPPLRTESYVGARLDAQLDEQSRMFLNGKFGAKFKPTSKKLNISTTKIMDWFGKDFGDDGAKAAFIRRYVPADKQRLIDQANGKFDFDYDTYDWALNDWRR